MVVAAALYVRRQRFTCSRPRVSHATDIFGLFASPCWTSDVDQTVHSPWRPSPLQLHRRCSVHNRQLPRILALKLCPSLCLQLRRRCSERRLKPALP